MGNNLCKYQNVVVDMCKCNSSKKISTTSSRNILLLSAKILKKCNINMYKYVMLNYKIVWISNVLIV